MLSINGYSNYYQPQFKARLNMPPKEVFEKYAGKFCAEQAEIARPAIEKIAKEKFGNLAGLAQQYLFYWRREA